MTKKSPRYSYKKGYKSGFLRGYQKGKIEGKRSLLPGHMRYAKHYGTETTDNNPNKTIRAFISAKNEERHIAPVIKSAFEAGINEVIVVANGCTDNTVALARAAGAKVIAFKQPLGYDVGRAIGLMKFAADVNILLDADFVVAPDDIHPFIASILSGVDLALNDLGPMYLNYASFDAVSIAKLNLNLTIGREDLGVNSLTAVPHALSGKAVKILGIDNLAIPPKALVVAVIQNLSIQAVHSVDVFLPNQIRPHVHSNDGKNLVAEMIIGDHLEAISYFLSKTDLRGGKTDLGRQRGLLRQWIKKETPITRALTRVLTVDTT